MYLSPVSGVRFRGGTRPYGEDRAQSNEGRVTHWTHLFIGTASRLDDNAPFDCIGEGSDTTDFPSPRLKGYLA